MTIRNATRQDQDQIGAIAQASGLFPAFYLEDMITPSFEDAPDIWLVSAADDVIDGFAFLRPEALADRVWNVLAIAVADTARNRGVATSLLRHIEQNVDARMMIIETTQLPDQTAARALYVRESYEEEGSVRDYYTKSEDKVTFRKVIA